MEDLVQIVNKKGIIYEVPRILAEKMLANGDIEHKDISEIEKKETKPTAATSNNKK